MPTTSRAAARSLTVLLVGAAVALTAAACVPEPEPAASPGASVTPTASVSASASASPTPAPTPGADIALPSGCDQLYSPTMRGLLESQNPPLNDPDVTMFSTQVVDALEVLDSGAPSIRCSWGQPSGAGLATTVTLVDAGQSDGIRTSLSNAGFSCADAEGGTLCTFEEELLTQDDTV